MVYWDNPHELLKPRRCLRDLRSPEDSKPTQKKKKTKEKPKDFTITLQDEYVFNIYALLYGYIYLRDNRLYIRYRERTLTLARVVWNIYNPDDMVDFDTEAHHQDLISLHNNIDNLIKMPIGQHRLLHYDIKSWKVPLQDLKQRTNELAIKIKTYLEGGRSDRKVVGNNLIFGEFDIIPKIFYMILSEQEKLTLTDTDHTKTMEEHLLDAYPKHHSLVHVLTNSYNVDALITKFLNKPLFEITKEYFNKNLSSKEVILKTRDSFKWNYQYQNYLKRIENLKGTESKKGKYYWED